MENPDDEKKEDIENEPKVLQVFHFFLNLLDIWGL